MLDEMSSAAVFADNRALIESCIDGDTRAWNTLVERYERLVYAIALREGLDTEDAADVLQETFTTLMKSLRAISEPDRLSYWLMTVARRESWRRRRKQRDSGWHPIGSADHEPEDDHSDETIQALWVYDAIQELGEPCRSLVLALFFDPEEPSYAEIAMRVGRPIGSLGPLRSRCLQQLRLALERLST
jgi:RNA polymerase sigma factor (sigma-70 family)